jgi:peptidyl-prolyl cis-trans isomerase A (cyclophilin A)
MRLRTAWLVPTSLAFALTGALVVLAPACSSKSTATAPTSADAGADAPATDSAPADAAPPPADTAPAKDPLEGCTRDPGPGDAGFIPDGGPDDPVGDASFDLNAALAGFPAGTGVLKAVITTETGELASDGGLVRNGDGGLYTRKIVCTLDEAKAPISVANFVGLARGTRPSLDTTRTWRLAPFYDGLIWHRVVLGFVIQGGDLDGTGGGTPGFDIANENHANEPLGTLAMAAGAGPALPDGGPTFVPSGSQFYIVVGKGPAADYNVFGSCLDTDGVSLDPTADLIQHVAVNGLDAPKKRLHMWKIDIGRCPK